MINNFFNNKNLTLLDQVIVSGSNFLMSILIIRYLNLSFFGKFAYCLIFIHFAISIQNSLLLSPNFTMINDKKDSTNYFSHILYLGFSLILILIILEYFYFQFYIKNSLNIFQINFSYYAVFSIIFLLHNFLKKIYLSLDKIISVIISDLIAFSLLFILFFVFLNSKGKLTVNDIFKLYMISYSVSLIIYLKFFKNLKSLNNINLTFNEFKKKGLPLFATQILHFFNANFWFINLGVVMGILWVGVFRSITNILQFFNILFQFFENYYPKHFKSNFDVGGISKLNRELKLFIIRYTFIISLSLLFIFLFSNEILNLLYGSIFDNYTKYFLLLLLLPIVQFFQYPYQFGLRVLDKPKYIFYSIIFPSFITVFLSKIIITKFNEFGFIFGLYIVTIILVGLQMYFFYSKKKII